MEDKHMSYDLVKIRILLQKRSYLKAKLVELSGYDGTPEVKELRTGKYIYIRKRVEGKLTSRYIGPYCPQNKKSVA